MKNPYIIKWYYISNVQCWTLRAVEVWITKDSVMRHFVETIFYLRISFEEKNIFCSAVICMFYIIHHSVSLLWPLSPSSVLSMFLFFSQYAVWTLTFANTLAQPDRVSFSGQSGRLQHEKETKSCSTVVSNNLYIYIISDLIALNIISLIYSSST